MQKPDHLVKLFKVHKDHHLSQAVDLTTEESHLAASTRSSLDLLFLHQVQPATLTWQLSKLSSSRKRGPKVRPQGRKLPKELRYQTWF